MSEFAAGERVRINGDDATLGTVVSDEGDTCLVTADHQAQPQRFSEAVLEALSIEDDVRLRTVNDQRWREEQDALQAQQEAEHARLLEEHKESLTEPVLDD